MNKKGKISKIYIILFLSAIVTLMDVTSCNAGIKFGISNFFKDREERVDRKIKNKEESANLKELERKLDRDELDELSPKEKNSPLLWDALSDSVNKKKEGKNAVYIKRIEICGNKLIKSEEILNTLELKRGDLYDKSEVKNNLKYIYDMGYFTDRMKAQSVKLDKNNIVLKIYVEENIPIADFTIEGNISIETGEILDILKDMYGKPQNLGNINDAIAKVEQLYTSKGYILAKVVSVNDDPDGVVNFEIDEGKIGRITFEGNKKTKDYVVKRNILTKDGEIYNENQIRSDLMRLYATQAFKDVTRVITPNKDNPNEYDVKICMEEQRTATISVGGGIDSTTGFFGSAGFVENNFLGRGQKLGLNYSLGSGLILSDSSTLSRANMQAEVNFFEPRFLNTDNALNIKLFGRDLASYQVPLAIEQRYGGEITLSHRFKEYRNVSGSLGLGIENINMKEGKYDEIVYRFQQRGLDPSLRKKQLEGGLFASISPSLTYDTRDNFANPRSGSIATLRFSQAVGLDDFNLSHGKISAMIKHYIPVAKKSSFSVSAKAGSKIYGDNMPEVMGYRLGGPYSIRGFKMSEVGTGQGFAMASAELQTPMFFLDRIEKLPFLNNVKLAFFADAGQIYNSYITDTLYNRPLKAISIGIGARVYIPGVGPLNIDYGYPITNIKSGSGKSKGAFTFGVGDMF